jgi:hypothetical protein
MMDHFKLVKSKKSFLFVFSKNNNPNGFDDLVDFCKLFVQSIDD